MTFEPSVVRATGMSKSATATHQPVVRQDGQIVAWVPLCMSRERAKHVAAEMAEELTRKKVVSQSAGL